MYNNVFKPYSNRKQQDGFSKNFSNDSSDFFHPRKSTKPARKRELTENEDFAEQDVYSFDPSHEDYSYRVSTLAHEIASEIAMLGIKQDDKKRPSVFSIKNGMLLSLAVTLFLKRDEGLSFKNFSIFSSGIYIFFDLHKPMFSFKNALSMLLLIYTFKSNTIEAPEIMVGNISKFFHDN